MNLTTSLNSLDKLLRFIASLKCQEILLLCFLGFMTLSVGVLTGYIPSPILTLIQQHNEQHETEERLVKISELQLYLLREQCLQGAKTATDRARCDRQSIKDVIIGSTDDALYSTLSANP